MINAYKAKLYCSEDISLIENYHEAISDEERTWEIHHRRECDSEGRTLFTHKQLKEMNLYHKRPASELIFVTRSMHKKLHREMCGKRGKKNGAINGKKNSIPILQLSKDWTLIKEWPSACEAGRHLGIAQSSICSCLKGRRKSAGGYVWRMRMDEEAEEEDCQVAKNLPAPASAIAVAVANKIALIAIASRPFWLSEAAAGTACAAGA